MPSQFSFCVCVLAACWGRNWDRRASLCLKLLSAICWWWLPWHSTRGFFWRFSLAVALATFSWRPSMPRGARKLKMANQDASICESETAILDERSWRAKATSQLASKTFVTSLPSIGRDRYLQIKHKLAQILFQWNTSSVAQTSKSSVLIIAFWNNLFLRSNFSKASHFKCLNKIGRVELAPTFATIRFWHRTTTEHVSSDGVQTFCSQLSKHSFARRANVMLPRSFWLRAAAFLLETFQLNNGCSGFWGCFLPLNSAAGKCFGPTNALHGVIRQLGSRRRPQYFWIPPRPHTPGPRGFLIATARIVS